MASKPKHTWEIATNAPTGTWKVGERVLWDRRLTLGEQRRAWLGDGDLSILANALTTLLVDGEPVTAEYLEELLTSDEVKLTFAYLLGGEKGVAQALADG